MNTNEWYQHQLDLLESQIERMKNCQNCLNLNNRDDCGECFRYYQGLMEINEVKLLDNWQLKTEET